MNEFKKSGLMLFFLLTMSQADAQNSRTNELEEIIVTATKQPESLSKVPVTVNAFSEAVINEAGIDSIQDVATLTPSLKAPFASSPFASRITIRGIGTYQTDPALEPSVGMFVDGVFLGRSGLGLSDLTDIERIEVLQGPQGTLYGKNANAGAISVITKKPNLDETEGSVEVTAGDYSLLQVNGSVTGPISDTVAYRISGAVNNRDGFYSNSIGDDLADVDDASLQGKLYWQPNDKLGLLLSASHLDRDNTCCGSDASVSDATNQAIAAAGLPVVGNDSGDFNVAVDHDSAFTNESDSVSLVLDYSMATLDFKSITAWNDHNFTSSFDADRTPLDVLKVDHYSEGNSLSQEFRFTSTGGNKFDYQFGLFYLDQEIQRGDGNPFATVGSDFVAVASLQGIPTPVPFGFLAAAGDYNVLKSKLKTETLALFGQSTWHVSDDLHITGGLRYTDETKDASLFTQTFSTAPSVFVIGTSLLDSFVTPIDADLSKSSDNLDGLIRISKDVGVDSIVFASYSTGTKSGGFNTSTGGAEDREFDDETTKNLELGFKYINANNTLRVNGTLFDTVIDDFQFQTQLPSGVGLFISNDAEIQVTGVDLQFEAVPTDNLRLYGGVLYMDKYEVTEGVNAGDELDYVSDWSANLGATLTFPFKSGDIYWRTDYTYTTDYFVTRVEQSESIINSKLGWRSDNFDFSLWAKNLTDERYVLEAPETLVFTGTDADNLAAPRTVGVSVNYNF